MKKEIVRHGEVILKPIDTLPQEAKKKEVSNKVVVAHSETGHHHVLESKHKDIEVFTWNGDTYLQVGTLSELSHAKTGADVHAPHFIVPSIYKVIIKKEFDYFENALRQVRD